MQKPYCKPYHFSHDVLFFVFRYVYKWFLLIYKISYFVGICGYVIMMATFLGLHFFFGKNELRTVQNKFLHLQIWPIDLYGMYTRSWHNANSLIAKFNQCEVWKKKPCNSHLVRTYSTSASEKKYVLSKNSVSAKQCEICTISEFCTS